MCTHFFCTDGTLLGAHSLLSACLWSSRVCLGGYPMLVHIDLPWFVAWLEPDIFAWFSSCRSSTSVQILLVTKLEMWCCRGQRGKVSHGVWGYSFSMGKRPECLLWKQPYFVILLAIEKVLFLLCPAFNFCLSESWKTIVLSSFMSTWHKLKSSEGKDPQLSKWLHRIRL